MNSNKLILEKLTEVYLKQKQVPSIWPHGNTNWKLSEDFGAYIKDDNGEYPTEACLGDRFIHLGFGLDSYGLWYGSTSDDWHGYSFGVDTKAAFKWLQKAKHKDLGWFLWSGLKIDVKETK